LLPVSSPFEESQNQLVRNLRSIGLDLERWIKKGLLRIHSARPTLYGLEMHLRTCTSSSAISSPGGGRRSDQQLSSRRAL